jgi:hypothetical protein
MGPEELLVIEYEESGQGSDRDAVMRRYPHGVTRRPTPARPTNGYGRSLRPGPDASRARRLLSSERRVETGTR